MGTVQLFDELDVSMESNAMTQIHETLDLLNLKLHAISTEGRISRAAAQQLVERYSVSFDPRYSVASFTQIPSQTNLSVAVEGILSTVGSKVIELVKQAIELLKKVFRWIIDFITFRKLRDAKAPKVVKNIVETNKATRQLHEVSEHQLETAVLEQAASPYLEHYNGLSADFLGKGKYLKLMRELQPQLTLLEKGIQTRIDLLEQWITRPPTTDSDVAAILNTSSVLEVMDADKLGAIVSRAGIHAPPNPKSAREWMQAVLIEVSRESLIKGLEPIPPITAIQILEQNRNGLQEPLLLIPDAVAKSADRYMGQLKKLQVRPLPETSETGRQIVEKLTQSIIDEVMSIQIFMSAINLYAGQRDQLVADLWRYSSFVYESTYKEVVTIGDEKIRRMAQSNVTLLRSKLKPM